METLPPRDPSAPPAVPDYQLLRVIGRGGYGEVWIARGTTGVYRAVKIVRRAMFGDDRPYEREFRGVREFEQKAPRDGRQIALLHVGRNDAAGFFYYVMELADDVVRGSDIDPESYVPLTLRELRHGPPLPVAKALEIGVALAGALGALHRAGLVHRDVKPSNVIFVAGVPKLADIGLVAPAAGDLTKVGTAAYLPAEGTAHPSGDVYALGKVIYELATGQRADEWPTWPAHLPAGAERGLFRALNHVLARACDPDPRKRYPDGDAFRGDLLLVLARSDPEANRRRLRRTARVIAALALVAVVASGGAWVQFKRAEKAEAERDAERQRAVYAATLGRGQRAIEEGDFGAARRFLNEVRHSPERGVEWGYLWTEAQGDPATIVGTADPTIRRLKVSANGRWWGVLRSNYEFSLAEGGSGDWRLTTRGVLNIGGISDDGRWLIGTARTGGFKRWNLLTGDMRGFGPAQGARLLGADAAAEHAVLFIDAVDGRPPAVETWDTVNSRCVAHWPLAAEGSESVGAFFESALAPKFDGLALATMQGLGSEAVWRVTVLNLRDGAGQAVFHTKLRASALALDLEAGTVFVALGGAAELAAYDCRTGRERWRKPTGIGAVEDLMLSADRQELAAAGRESAVRIFGVKDGESSVDFRGVDGAVVALLWPQDLPVPVTLDAAGEVRTWHRVSKGTRPREIGGLWRPAGGGRVLAVSEDGELVAATDDPKHGTGIWRTRDGGLVGRISGLSFPACFEGSELNLQSSFGGWASVAVAGDAALEARWTGSSQSVAFGVIAVDPTRDDFVGSMSGGRLARWRRSSSRLDELPTPTNQEILAATFSPVPGKVVVVDATSRAYEIDLDRRLPPAEIATGVVPATISSRGLLALGGNDGSVRFFRRNSDRWEAYGRTQTGSSRIQHLCFSARGERLVAGGTGGSVHVLSGETLQELVTVRVPMNDSNSERTVSFLRMSADTRVLAAYLNDGRIRFWMAGSTSPVPLVQVAR